MPHHLILTLPLSAVLCFIAYHAWLGYHAPSQPRPAPVPPGDAGELAADVAGMAVTLASLVWLAVAFAVFFAPLGLLAWWLVSPGEATAALRSAL